MSKIRISLLMCIHKEDSIKNFDIALQSIINQTVRPNETIIVKDGPVSNEVDIIISKFYKEMNGFIVNLENNIGLGAALNEGLKYCKEEYVARFDADDICYPHRLEKQINFLENNINVDVLSAQVDEYDECMEKYHSSRLLPLEHSEIYSFAKKRNPINHPAVIFRKKSVLSVGGYPPFRKAQDYALWSLMLVKGFKFANHKEVLLKMRGGNSMMKRRGLRYFIMEYEILKFQRNIGFINLREFYINMISRFIIRIMPSKIKMFIYKFLR